MLQSETIDLYEWLIQTESVLTITLIDDFGLPWGEVTTFQGGAEISHILLLNHDGIEKL